MFPPRFFTWIKAVFTNPLGLLALLGIPAILAIHFLQRKAVSIPISTLFLIERTQRETTSGRRFDRLTPSIPLWMQLLAVLLLTWFLAEPRFQKANSIQRVAVVVDSSASMAVFKKDAIAAIGKELPALKGAASNLQLTLLHSLPGTDRLYAGTSIEEFSAALETEHFIKAINQGQIFRFVKKPASPADIQQAVHEAVRQYDIELLQQQLLRDQKEIDKQLYRSPYWLYRLRVISQQSFRYGAPIFGNIIALMLALGVLALSVGICIILIVYFVKSYLGIDIFSQSHFLSR